MGVKGVKIMKLLSSLTRNQREAVGLLQIGTLLEYFDLMLYVHMAVLLNELFFPKTDPHTASLLSAFAFCSTFVLRPFGAFLFGYIGDHVGRKTTVILTTAMMSLSCIVMANVPTYAQIGISASWAVTLCRIIQGLSSMGEIVAAEIYLSELVKPPAQYPVVGLMSCSSAFGTMMALGVAMVVFSLQLEWRLAFWFGATIALIGTVARTRLRETPEFADTKQKRQRTIEKAERAELMHSPLSSDGSTHVSIPLSSKEALKQAKAIGKEKVNQNSSVAFFLLYCAWPACFYFSYVHCAGILKHDFGYTAQEIIQQNFVVSIVQCVGYVFFALLSYSVHPLKIIRWKGLILTPFFVICPYLLNSLHNGIHVFWIQSFVIFFGLTAAPAMPIFIKSFPVFKRFTYTSFIYALTRALMYVITSFGLVYLTEMAGNFGLWGIMIPSSLAFLWGVSYFERLEKKEHEGKKPLRMAA